MALSNKDGEKELAQRSGNPMEHEMRRSFVGAVEVLAWSGIERWHAQLSILIYRH